MNNNLIASDSWISGSLNASWGAIHGMSVCQVVSGSPNVVEANVAGTEAGQQWGGAGFIGDQISEFTIQSINTSSLNYACLWTRLQSGNAYGYKLIVYETNCAVYVYTSGGATQIGSTVTSLTIAAGDVWSFVARGGFLIVYQNGAQVFYAADATWTTGVPGFSIQVASSVADCQISAWRGYGCQQQDGVWKKNAAVTIPFKSGNSRASPAGNGTFDNALVLYEGGAKVLSGTVYKMWYTTFDSTNGANICYAESSDGITYTPYGSNPVIPAYGTPGIIKNGSTYYLYCQSASALGSGAIHLYTSTDGVSWSLVNANVLSMGTGGAWDSAFLYVFNPIAIVSGTWYALYGAGSNTTTYEISTGLATSSDGVNWTKYAGNPVISNFYPTQAFANVGGNWYIWGARCDPNQHASPDNYLDPDQCVRLECTDGTFANWTNTVNSIHTSNVDEDINGNTGQSYFNSLIEINGSVYGYITSAISDSSVPTDYQITLATVPATLANLVAYPEDAAKQIASDAFTNGPGSLSANWTAVPGNSALQIVSGPYVEASVINTDCIECYTGATFANDQYSEITIATLSAAANYAMPAVRCSTGANTMYFVLLQGPTNTLYNFLRIYKRVGGSSVQIGPNGTLTLQPGDKIRLTVTTGSDGFPILSAYQNGFLVRQVEDYSNAITTGYPGIRINAATLADAQVSSWAGGNANVLPSYVTSQPYLPLLGCGA